MPVRWYDGGRGSPLPVRVSRALIDRAGVPWYDERSLAIELWLVRALLSRRSSICHALYVPDVLRYSPLGRRPSAGGRLVATVHQPPAAATTISSANWRSCPSRAATRPPGSAVMQQTDSVTAPRIWPSVLPGWSRRPPIQDG
ncbi:MAG: hypothetical protein ACJ766_09835 [Thermoleophilaceae bacterium]